MGKEPGIGKARDLSKVTRPVSARTKIQAVPAPRGGGEEIKVQMRAGGNNPERRKRPLIFSDTA